MHRAPDDNTSVPSEGPNDSFCPIVADLASLLDHVHASIESVETAMAQETSGNQDHANVVVLDDVTPLYANAASALCACDARLTAALRFLMRARPSSQQGHRKVPAASPVPCSMPGEKPLPAFADRAPA